MLTAYVRAWQDDDVEGLVLTLREDVRLAMPPVPSWYEGRAAVLGFLRRWIFSQGRFRLEPAFANAQPAFVILADAPAGAQVLGLQVLTLDAAGISAIDSFMTPELVAPHLDPS
jgi:RNA polymerase sigma-70 factor (ECF subfamily)